MARLKNVSGSALLLYSKPGQADSFRVAAGGITTVPGEVDEKATERAGDAYIIDGRAWPMALWQVTAPGDQDVEEPVVERPRGRRNSGADSASEGE